SKNPPGVHFAGDEAHDFEVGLGAHGVDGELQTLDFAGDVGDGAVLLVRAGGREDDVGLAGGFGEEHVLDDEETAPSRSRLSKSGSRLSKSGSRLLPL